MITQDVYKHSYSFDSIIIVRARYFKADFKTNKADLIDLFNNIEKRRYTNAKI